MGTVALADLAPILAVPLGLLEELSYAADR